MNKKNIIVQKYGGSSVSNPQNIQKIAEAIIDRKKSGDLLVVVVSAMGDSTDELISIANSVTKNNLSSLREMDILLSTGELVSSALMSMALISKNCDAISLSGLQAGIQTDPIHGSARISNIKTDRILNEIHKGNVVVIAGFQGYSNDGDTTTLGRGGSDTSAVALAVSLGAKRCEIYTDVEGIFTTDPRIINSAKKLKEINFNEMLQMASLGAKMNPRSIELAAINDMPIYVCSTFSKSEGTLIHGGNNMEDINPITGIAIDRNISKISIIGIKDEPGIAANLLKPLSDEGISVDVIVQNSSINGNTDFTFTVSDSDLNRATKLIENQNEISYSQVITGKGLSKVSLVGTGMQNSPGYASKMFKTLADSNVNIDMITTSEIRITVIIKSELVEIAVSNLHKSFNLDKS